MPRACSSGIAALATILFAGATHAQATVQMQPEWTTPIAPFHIAGNVYYVGSKDLASYLIVTPKGDILINSSLEASVPLIRRSVEQLGFQFTDIKILLISHAHIDHDAGSAEIIRETGAKYMVMDGDVPVVESGGAKDFAYPTDLYPPTKVDRVLHDGDEVKLGDTVLVAHKTSGHTRGCTTWTVARAGGRAASQRRHRGELECESGLSTGGPPGAASFVSGDCGANTGAPLTVLKALPCDVFLGAHGAYFDMLAKLDKIKSGATGDVWIDPQGYQAAVAEREQAFQTELKRQEN